MPGKKKRIRSWRKDGKQYRKNPKGGRSSHVMASGGKSVWTTLYPKKKTTTSHKPKDWEKDESYESAKKRGETVKFTTKKRAHKMGHGLWKKKKDNPFKTTIDGVTPKEKRKEVRKEYKEIKKESKLHRKNRRKRKLK
tara:strand:+ start:463 stop:876 length:414 start_codon:yes stop_codon:yes gene_type:complete